MWSLASIIVLFVAIFPYAEYVYQFLVQPLAENFQGDGWAAPPDLHSPHEAFFTYIKLSRLRPCLLPFRSFPCSSGCLWHLGCTSTKKGPCAISGGDANPVFHGWGHGLLHRHALGL